MRELLKNLIRNRVTLTTLRCWTVRWHFSSATLLPEVISIRKIAVLGPVLGGGGDAGNSSLFGDITVQFTLDGVETRFVTDEGVSFDDFRRNELFQGSSVDDFGQVPIQQLGVVGAVTMEAAAATTRADWIPDVVVDGSRATRHAFRVGKRTSDGGVGAMLEAHFRAAEEHLDVAVHRQALLVGRGDVEGGLVDNDTAVNASNDLEHIFGGNVDDDERRSDLALSVLGRRSDSALQHINIANDLDHDGDEIFIDDEWHLTDEERAFFNLLKFRFAEKIGLHVEEAIVDFLCWVGNTENIFACEKRVEVVVTCSTLSD